MINGNDSGKLREQRIKLVENVLFRQLMRGKIDLHRIALIIVVVLFPYQTEKELKNQDTTDTVK